MTINKHEIEEMAKLRRILDGLPPEPTTDNTRKTVSEAAPVIGSTGDQNADMKAILMAFYNSTDSLERVTESAENGQRFTQALNTELTDDGVKVGSWKIEIKESSGNKTFDIYHVQTLDSIATDLTLYETALAITTCLNKKMSINSPRIREILNLEDKYAAARYEAAVFKRKARRLVESENIQDALIAEARYDEAKSTAIYYRNKIRNISSSL